MQGILLAKSPLVSDGVTTSHLAVTTANKTTPAKRMAIQPKPQVQPATWRLKQPTLMATETRMPPLEDLGETTTSRSRKRGN